MQTIDIHSHILPGVDDGSPSMEQSLAMLWEAQRQGVEGMVLTPHQKMGRHSITPDAMEALLQRLQEEAVQNGIRMRLYRGNELFYRKELTALLQEGQVCTLADSSYALIEFSPTDDFFYIRNGLYEVLSAGYHPILAHAERYHCMERHRERIEELCALGCYIQVNAGSILGELGFGMKHELHGLLCRRLVHFVATDAHDLKKRRIRMAECAKRLQRKYGERYAAELLYDNPRNVIKDREI